MSVYCIHDLLNILTSSCIFQVTGAYENVFISHSSWYVYAGTLRIYKHYDFNLKDASTATGKLSFSSYPGQTNEY